MNKLLEQINTDKQEMTLGDVVTFHRGYDLPLTEIRKGIYPVVFSNGRKEYHDEFKVKAPGVFTGRSGSLGGMFYVEEDYWPHNTTLYVSDFHNNDPKYCYYFLSSFDFSKYNAGTGVPTLNRNHIHGIPVKIPSLPTQKRIAEILSAYDAKIENNNKIVKNLEATAQTIFNEWFINFKFPGYEKAKMVESEVGEIPEGWTDGKIKDLIWVESGFPFSSSVFNDLGKYKLVTIRNVQDGSFVTDCDNLIAELSSKLPKHCLLHSGDILLSLTGNVGRICLVNGENYVLNQRVSVLVPINERDRAYTYFLFRRNDFQNLLISISKGTAQLNLSPVETKELEAIIPSISTLQKYSEIATPMYKKIVEINSENINLKQSRDQLLAKLI